MKNGKIMVVIYLMLASALLACAEKYDSESDFRVDPVEGSKSVQISEYLGSKKEVRIPPTINNMPVTHIGDYVFEDKNLTNISIPNSVTFIGRNAFSANKLTSINIPNSVESIMILAFADNQLTSVSFPTSVTTISNVPFLGNPLTSITIGSRVSLSNRYPGRHVEWDNFVRTYNDNGGRAGTYTLSGSTWIRR